VVTRLEQFNLWNKTFNEKPTKIHVAPCVIDHCPYKDTILSKIKNSAGIEIVEGTHPYIPRNIFG
jgi:predicted metal-binding protein